jgi:hypothetical protein
VAVEPPPGWKLNGMTPLRWRVAVDGNVGPIAAAQAAGLAGTVKAERDGTPPSVFSIALPITADSGVVKIVVSIDAILCEEAGTTCRPTSARAKARIVLDAEAAPGVARVALP